MPYSSMLCTVYRDLYFFTLVFKMFGCQAVYEEVFLSGYLIYYFGMV